MAQGTHFVQDTLSNRVGLCLVYDHNEDNLLYFLS
jgi:hypothetical protein